MQGIRKSDPDRWSEEVFTGGGVFDRLTITFVATVPYPADPDKAATRRKQFAGGSLGSSGP
jgi:hypothetical protein